MWQSHSYSRSICSISRCLTHEGLLPLSGFISHKWPNPGELAQSHAGRSYQRMGRWFSHSGSVIVCMDPWARGHRLQRRGRCFSFSRSTTAVSPEMRESLACEGSDQLLLLPFSRKVKWLMRREDCQWKEWSAVHATLHATLSCRIRLRLGNSNDTDDQIPWENMRSYMFESMNWERLIVELWLDLSTGIVLCG
jgi:hypothetical protein